MRLRTLFSALSLLCIISAQAIAQHPVLFETFTNVCQPCPAPGRQVFDDDVNSVLSGLGSKIIHLDYHISNECDEMQHPFPVGGIVGGRLAAPNSNPIFYGAVDRTIFSSSGVRASPVASGGSNSDWGDAINALAGNSAPASITLVNATLDTNTTGSFWSFHADVKVTATSAIPDKINIYYAVVQDGVRIINPTYSGLGINLCSPEKVGPYNDVVRWASTSGTPVFSGGTAVGTSKIMSLTQSLYKPTSDPTSSFKDMRFIAFIEESSNTTDYHIVNAAELKSRLDTLKAPVPTLAVTDTALDNHVFHAGTSYFIFYSGSHLIHGLRAFYSLDNGANWLGPIVDSFSFFGNYFTWSVPDVSTTQGKIKLVSVDDGSLVSIEKGTFSIIQTPSVQILHPTASDTVVTGKHFMIRWSAHNADTIKKIILTTGIADTRILATQIVKDTFFDWAVPDTNVSMIGQIQIVPTDYETTLGASPSNSEKFTIQHFITGGVASPMPRSEFGIVSITPNPSMQAGDITVLYELPEASDVSFEVFDVLGQPVTRQTVHSASASSQILLPLAGLPSGSYILRMSDYSHSVSKRLEILR